MRKKFRVFDKKNQRAMSEWDRINAAIMSSDGKRQLTSKDVEVFEDIVEEHDSSLFTDERMIASTPKRILTENGGTHWTPLGEYTPICSSHPKWSMDDPGDKDSLYYPYIPNDAELMEEIYRDRKGAKKLVTEHQKAMGWNISRDLGSRYNRREGF